MENNKSLSVPSAASTEQRWKHRQNAAAQESRHRMTRRRHELTNKIRKQKKSSYLARKRSSLTVPASMLSSSESPTSTTPTSMINNDGEKINFLQSISNMIHSYCGSPTAETLQNISTTMHTTPSAKQYLMNATGENPLLVLSQDHVATATKFLQLLREGPVQEDVVLPILVQLTAISYIPTPDYYGYTPVSWSTLLVQDSNWVSLLVRILHAKAGTISGATTGNSSLQEAACIILGNLVGEPSTATILPVLIQAGMIPALLSVIPDCPAAAWALTNTLRQQEDDTTSTRTVILASSLLHPDGTQNFQFRPELLEQWLQDPRVGAQAAWMLCALARLLASQQHCNESPGSVEAFFFPRGPDSTSSLVSTVLRLLGTASATNQEQIVPLLQALGNLACREDYVSSLIRTEALSTQSLPSPLVSIVSEMMQRVVTTQPTAGGTNFTTPSREAANTVAWLAGCILCDAGLTNHPSTTLAAPVLIPLLFHQLGQVYRSSSATSSSVAIVAADYQRELANALWNALSLPPILQGGSDSTDSAMSSSDHTPILLPTFDNMRPAITTMVSMLPSSMSYRDNDAMLAALRVIDLLLRRYSGGSVPLAGNRNGEELRRLLIVSLQEDDAVSGLEKICEAPINVISEDIAEVAANLLDDFFYNDDDDDDTGGDFDVSVDRPRGFVFSSQPTTVGFGDPTTVAPHTTIGFGGSTSSAGMGRGRGKQLPSWMAKSPS